MSEDFCPSIKKVYIVMVRLRYVMPENVFVYVPSKE